VQVEPVKGTPAETKPDLEFEASLREKFPGRDFLAVSGQGQFTIKPGTAGKKGFSLRLPLKATILKKSKHHPAKTQRYDH